MRSYSYFTVLFVIVMHCCVGSSEGDVNEKTLSRKRRYLAFPEGSTFVVSWADNYNFII